jgi:hypothetical protein
MTQRAKRRSSASVGVGACLLLSACAAGSAGVRRVDSEALPTTSAAPPSTSAETAPPDSTPDSTSPGGVEVDAFDLKVGDCLPTFQDGVIETQVVVPCDVAHDGEVYLAFDVADAPEFPGNEAIFAQGDAQCSEAFVDFVGVAYLDSALEYSYYFPTEESWRVGDREVLCIVLDPAGPVVGTLAGANR